MTKMTAKKMPKVLTVRVTAHDIRYGKQNDTHACAIARACKREYGDCPKVTAGGVLFSFDGKEVGYERTRKQLAFMEMFDDDRKMVEPTTFTFRRK